MKQFTLFGFISALLWSLAGCTNDPPLTTAKMSGIYSAKYSHGTETLELKSDGTFTQNYVSATNATPTTNSGKWNLGQVKGQWVLTLWGALIFDDHGQNKPAVDPKRTNWGLNVHQSSGRIWMPVDPDDALKFEKQ